MKIFPKDLGLWIWQISQCDNGNWTKIIARCQSAGIKWLAIKSGDATRNNNLILKMLKRLLTFVIIMILWFIHGIILNQIHGKMKLNI